MPSRLFADVYDRMTGVASAIIPSIELKDIDQKDFPANFPYNRWTAQLEKYHRYWWHFTGEVWQEEIPNKEGQAGSGQPRLRYPLQINYIKPAALRHAYVLFGEVADTPGPLVPMRVTPRLDVDEESPTPDRKRKALELQNFLNHVWIDNNGRTLQLEGGTVSQYLGGIVYKVSYDPSDTDLEFDIKLAMILPDFFLPVWDSSNPDKLLECFVVWRMPAREAELKYGYDAGQGSSDSYGGGATNVLYVEHWTDKSVSITINNKPIVYEVNGEDIDFTEQVNVFGIIPFVYIPRERAGGFYGLSIVDDTEGLEKELNARLADVGDVIHEASHREIFVRNVKATISTKDLGGIRDAIDLGNTNTITQSDKPEAFAIDPPNLSDALMKYPDFLREQFGRDAFTPPVALGEDEGSQRSALTLAFRMWPITSKARAQRTYWTMGLIRLAKIIIRIALCKGIGGITLDHLKNIDYSCDWSPMIPRDREQIVNELILAVQTNLVSPMTALGILDMVSDPYEENAKVREWLSWLYQQQAQAKAAQGQDGAMTQIQEPIATSGMDQK